MKAASQLLEELLRETRPPSDCAITLTELHPRAPDEPNWIAGIELAEQDALARYNAKFHELRDGCPCVDWSGVQGRIGERRRLTKWASELAR